MGRRSRLWCDEQPAAERFDRAVELLLIVLLIFMPLALGTVHAWSEEVVIVLAAAISLVFLLKLVFTRSVSFVWSWAYVSVALFIGEAVFQIMPLPAPLAERLSPDTVAVKADLLSDLPNVQEVLSSVTLSFYPRSTKHGLRLALAVAAVFIVVINVYRQPERIKRLLAAVAATGGAIVLLALAQDLGGNGKIYWLVPTYNNACSGTFVDHNHFGQFVNLSIGAALGLLCVILHEAFTERYVTPAGVADYIIASPAGRPVLLLGGMVVLGAAAVFLSLTRGGMTSMLIAAGFTTLMMSWRRSLKGNGRIMVLLAMGAFICILYVGFDQAYDRLASLRDSHGEPGGRGPIVWDAAVAWTRFPVFGTGLGTHSVVHPMFDRAIVPSLAMHAENEYGQIAEEMGSIGLLSLVFLGTLAWLSYGRNVKSVSIPIRSAAYGLGFGLLAILIHSLGDFGRYLPANAVLVAICVALLIALARVGAEDGGLSPDVCCLRFGGAARVLVLLLAGGVWTWAIVGADRARNAEASWRKAVAAEGRLEADNWHAPPQAYEYLFEHAGHAVASEPENIQYRYWLGVYKWLSLTPYIDPNSGILRPEAVPWARRIVEELHQVRPLCPTFGVLYGAAGEIQKFILNDPDGARMIRTGYRLAPYDAMTCFVAARVDAEEGKIQEAFEKLKRAVQLDDKYFRRAVRLCIKGWGEGCLALQLADGDADRLSYVTDRLTASLTSESSSGEDREESLTNLRLIKQARAEMFDRLRRRCEEPDAPAQAHASLASVYRQQGDLDLAIRHYRCAVRLDYDQVGWRYALAQLLAQTSDTQEAIHEAQVCLRLQEDFAPARELLRCLTGNSVTDRQPLPAR